ncbi:hypothetical protein [Mycolicibacterium vinylchloridicum]|uniref:hypothetical protein n=1 Tax=Mycolicibacterium vinylchloridicum TaxID=2736928 RepID=UPI0015CDDEFA|nr:hypothetical protein [Mycolicibacterium vinylchloridicum]
MLARSEGLGRASLDGAFGVGVGVAMSAGAAWRADLGGGSGSVLAGVSLSAGFGCGPVVSALIAQFSPAPVQVPAVHCPGPPARWPRQSDSVLSPTRLRGTLTSVFWAGT